MIRDYEREEDFRKDSIPKEIIITLHGTTDTELGNEDIYAEEFSLIESICSEDNLVFGSCEAGKIEFTTNRTDLQFSGKSLTVEFNIVYEDTDYPLTIGTYYVNKETLTSDRSKKHIEAYDSMYVINNSDVTEWYNGVFSLSETVLLYIFRESFFDYLGIEQESESLVNDNVELSKTIESQQISGSDIIKAICELNGVCGHITRQNTFKYVSFGSTSDYHISMDMYKTYEYEDYTTGAITGLQIRSEENDIGVQVGTNDNPYIVEGNFLIAGKGTAELTLIAQNLFDKIRSVTYVPSKVECIGNPCVEVGDRVTIYKSSAPHNSTYVMQREMHGIQSLFDTVESSGEKVRTEQMNGITYQITKLKGKSNVLERTIEGTTSRVTDLESGLTEVTQTATELNIKVESLQSQIDGEQQYYEYAGVPTLTNYPAYDFTYSIPCNNTIKVADDLGFEYKDEWYQKHLLNLYFDTDGAMSYRFQKNEQGGFYWREVADGQISQISQRLHTVEITADGLTSSVQEITQIVSSQGTAIDTIETSINQMAGQISLKASQSSVNALGERVSSAESELNIQSSRIDAKVSTTGGTRQSFAWTLDTSGFYLVADGQDVMGVTRNGLSVKGNIEALSGKIGKWSVDENGMFFRRNDGGNTHFQNDGNIVGYDSNGNVGWFINANGQAQFNNVTVNGYATTGQLNATNLEVAQKVTAQQVQAMEINAEKITTGTLSVDRLNVDGIVQSFSGKSVTMTTCLTRNFMLYDTNRQIYRSVYIDGNTIRVSS